MFERNVRFADENLLNEGNFTDVPTVDVIKKAGEEFYKRYLFDEDMYKEVRIFRYLTRALDTTSKQVRGKLIL